MKRRKLIQTIEKMTEMLNLPADGQHHVPKFLATYNKNVTLNLFQGLISKSLLIGQTKTWLNTS